MLSIFNGVIYGLGLFSFAVIVGGIVFVLYVAIGNHRQTRGQQQEALARHVEPVQQERHTEPMLAWIEGVDLDALGKEG